MSHKPPSRRAPGVLERPTTGQPRRRDEHPGGFPVSMWFVDADVGDFLLARLAEDGEAVSRGSTVPVHQHTDSIRRVVQECREYESAYRAAVDAGRSTTERLERHAAWASFARAVRILALPYRDHPGYQPEWSPDWRPTPSQS